MTWPTPDTIAVRAYMERPNSKPIAQKKPPVRLDEPSGRVLIFDTETRTDPSQSLRVGFYQVRDGVELVDEGAFFDPEALDRDERAELEAYCVERKLEVLTVNAFNEDVFLKIGYNFSGTIVGFNLPFDISRIAISHGAARGTMRGGFSFELTRNTRRPRVRIKQLSARASLIDFARPGINETARSSRKRGQFTPSHRGYFTDVKTLAAALTSRSFSLEALCDFLGVPTLKKTSTEHGGPLSDAYLDYAREDVQTT
jgi:hypothetical protein